MVGLVAAENQTRAFLAADVDVVEVCFPLLFVHRRPHIDRLVQAGADFDFPRRVNEPVDEGVFN